MIFSCIIPCLDKEDPKLKDLIRSIRQQEYPQDLIEILVISEGGPEEAKAIGIRKAQGEICAMFCADNFIVDRDLFYWVDRELHLNRSISAIYPDKYAYVKSDNSLNRYFSMIGGNDPVCWYLGKNDRKSYVESLNRTSDYHPTYGENGFFYRTEHIRQTDLDNYSHIDNSMEVPGEIISIDGGSVWHRTADGLLTILKKRYKYARDLYCDSKNRRWKMLDGKRDLLRLACFVASTLTVVGPLTVSIRGYRHNRDLAWAWHWPVCVGFLLTYGVLTCRNLLKFQSLFQRPDQKTLRGARTA